MEILIALFLISAGIAIALGLIALGIIYRGWALSVLWGWFMVPLGLPVITIPMAIGISIVIGMFHQSQTTAIADEYKDKNAVNVNLVIAWLGPILSVGIGYIVKSYL